MILSGALLLLLAPLAVAGSLLFLRRWPIIVAGIATLTTTLLGCLVAFAPLNEATTLGTLTFRLGRPLTILGRPLVVEAVDRLPLAFIFFTTAGLFLIAWRLIPRSNFFPIGLMIVTMLVGALLVQQVVYAALLVEMATILTIFPLHEYGGRTQGGLRFLAYATLALPGLMITQLLLELFAIFPNDLGLLQSSTVLLGISFAILLGAVPFQSWLSTVAMDGSSPVVTFIFTVHLGTVWFMLLAYLQSYTWLSTQPLFGPLFTNVGLLMMVIGGALAASQPRLGRLVGYATLVDNGAMFVALGTLHNTGLALTVLILLARPLALGLMTVGLEGLRRLSGTDTIETVEGDAWRAPWRAVAFVVGGIALAGFPLSRGFTARWGLYRLLSEVSFFQALLALIGTGGVMMGLIGAIRVLLAPIPPTAPRAPLQEDPIVLVLIVLLISITILLGLFPQSASHIALQMANGFTFFAP